MPKFEDLPYLREKIASIADETEVMRKKGKKRDGIEETLQLFVKKSLILVQKELCLSKNLPVLTHIH